MSILCLTSYQPLLCFVQLSSKFALKRVCHIYTLSLLMTRRFFRYPGALTLNSSWYTGSWSLLSYTLTTQGLGLTTLRAPTGLGCSLWLAG
jgi:hypothetical protein